MLNAIPASFILDYAKSCGAYEQLPLFLTPPHYEIDEEYCCNVYAGYSCPINEQGKNFAITKHVDHPAFTALKSTLEYNGYIKTEQWINGDRVLKEFYINDVLFKEGDQFPCASAIRYKLFGTP